MAYFRTLRSGETRLIFTAKDRRRQQERRRRTYSGPKPHITAINDLSRLFRHRRWQRQDVEHFRWWYEYDPAKMQAAIAAKCAEVRHIQRRLLLSLKREHGRISPGRAWSGQEPLTIDGETRQAEAIPGYVAHYRLVLAHAQAELRDWQMAFELYTDHDKRALLRYLGGHAYHAPHSR